MIERRICIFGATSAIAQAIVHELAKTDPAVARTEHVLVGSSAQRLGVVEADLTARYACPVATYVADLSVEGAGAELAGRIWSERGPLDTVIVAHGILGDQLAAETSAAITARILRVNFLSYVEILTPLASLMAGRSRGSIIVLSSVAGDRGRRSNYVYGAAKAGVTAFTQGLRNRYFSHGVRILTVKPGMISTPMTAHLPKTPLFSTPEKVAQDVSRALRAGKDVIYTPFYWRWIMLIIRVIPERVFKKMKL